MGWGQHRVANSGIVVAAPLGQLDDEGALGAVRVRVGVRVGIRVGVGVGVGVRVGVGVGVRVRVRG